tara:strand:- start:193 stop:447 length:255 start_codon:yes stop_codon:yes gene_type:complete
MPKYYVETIENRLIIDKEGAEQAAKHFIGLNPDIVYQVMKSNQTMFIFVSEKGFSGADFGEYRSDMMFDVIELVHKMGPSGGSK